MSKCFHAIYLDELFICFFSSKVINRKNILYIPAHLQDDEALQVHRLNKYLNNA